MFKRMLVGVDGRQGGREAIALAQTLSASCPGGDVVLGHVHVEATHSPRRRSSAPPETMSMAVLTSERTRVNVDADVVWAIAGSPADGFSELMRATRADLLVLGSSHRGTSVRALLGDDTTSCLRTLSTAAAIAPAGCVRGSDLRSIGIAHDGSAAASAAMTLARELGSASGAKLICACIIPPQRFPYGEDVDAGIEAQAAALFSDEETRLLHDEHIQTFVGFGQPSPALAEFSRTVDLLVIGAPQHLRQHLSASASTAVSLTLRAHCPLLVTAPGPAAEILPARADVGEELQPQR